MTSTMPNISRISQKLGTPVLDRRSQIYSDRLTLVSASSLWMSQYSKGPKKFQFGPRRNVPSTMSDAHSTANPYRNTVISTRRSLKVKYPFPFGFLSMYGMQIKPTMISPGSTTPASHGSKYTSISCNPRKYHGAFDGFGVFAGFAGCSSGAFRKIDQTIRITEQRMSEMSSVYTRSGHTHTRSDSAFSIGPSPAAIRRSFNTASRIEYHTKNRSRKMRPTIGTLSGLVTIRRKLGSNEPTPKKMARNPRMP